MVKYSDDLRKRALKLSDEIGTKKAAEELEINFRTLEYWRGLRKREEAKKAAAKIGKIIQPEQQLDIQAELKDNPNITFQAAEKPERTFHRGEIYYVTQRPTVGSEIVSGRPAVIVSNNNINEKLNTVEVVFLTTRMKSIAPEHIIMRSSGATSTTICEQISTVDKSRFREYIGECTPDEMKQIDKALLHSLGLENYDSNLMSDEQVIYRLSTMKSDLDTYKKLYNDLLEKLMSKR